MRILLASTNHRKIVELRQILGLTGVEVVEIGDLATTEQIETGSTFRENALLKARQAVQKIELEAAPDGGAQ